MSGHASQPLLHHQSDLETGASSPRNFAEIIQSDPEGAISTIQQVEFQTSRHSSLHKWLP